MEAMVSYDANLEVCRDEANESGPDRPHPLRWLADQSRLGHDLISPPGPQHADLFVLAGHV